jgi:hypothetical protein
MKQIMLTSAAGKRLIGKALAAHPDINRVLNRGTLVIIAGTTNGYVAEEIISLTGETLALNRQRFIRGITLPPGYKVSDQGRLTDESGFPGDVVMQNGVWLKGKTINDVAGDLKEGDIILKGANALDLARKRAAILIGNVTGGTIMPTLQVLIGRRIRLMLPVGLEKRISGDLDNLANKINAPGASGYRLLPVPGEVFTEIDALSLLTGVTAELFASGGICGAEGGVWLAFHGTPDNEESAARILKTIANEPAFTLG